MNIIDNTQYIFPKKHIDDSTYNLSNPFNETFRNKLTPSLVISNSLIGQTINTNYHLQEPDILRTAKIDNTYQIYDDLQLDIGLEQNEIQENNDICQDCDIRMKITESAIICENCGLEKKLEEEYCSDVYNISVDTNYNSGTTSSLPFMFSGKKSYGYQKALLKCCSDYTNASYQLIKKEILNRINMYNGNKPPMNVQLVCVDLYYKIKESDKSYLNIINKGATIGAEKKRLVFRSNGKWGIIASCLYYACIKEGLTRTPREISEIIGVEEKYQSIGNKRLQEFYELGIIDIPINIDLINDYISRYFPLLDIPDIYKEFIVDLIDRAENKYLHINNESRSSTKCVGAIYMLCSRVPELNHITKEVISKECKVSKTTFMKYYQMLYNNYEVLKKTFKKHNIPMPIEWKDERKKN